MEKGSSRASQLPDGGDYDEMTRMDKEKIINIGEEEIDENASADDWQEDEEISPVTDDGDEEVPW